MLATRSVILLAAAVGAAASAWAIDFPGPAPGPARASLAGDQLTLENALVEVRWDLARLRVVEAVDRAAKTRLPLDSELVRIALADGRELPADAFRPAAKPKLERLGARPDAVRLAERCAGWQAAMELASRDGRTRLRWQASLRDGDNAVRQHVALLAHEGARPAALTLLDFPAYRVLPCGTVDGSPLVAGDFHFFVALEHPMAKNVTEEGRAVCRLPLFESPAAGLPQATAVIGVAPADQFRRAFLYDLERHRARPYRPFTYYISWFDIAAPGLKMTESQCLEVIDAFGTELTTKRGAKLDAFVFDDGWDDNRTLWRFHAGFPRGFAPLGDAARRYGAILGTWISPFGGYGQHKKERLEFGRSQGYETNRSGFALSGPKYFETFLAVCEEMIRRYGIGYLKFDGMGGGSSAGGPGADFGGDMQALVHLFDRLRALRPEVFINATTGTWPSPYWLLHSDSVWRGGSDVGYLGAGTRRQQWITYRDALGHKIRTERGPLFPFNSLKFQSVIFARLSLAADLGTGTADLVDDIHMAAASGTQLQEFFVTPAMVPPGVWDVMAETIGWVQRNADVLVDTHGIGGDPAKGEVYGFASWSPRLGILALRNPTGQPARYTLDLRTDFELRAGAAERYVLRTPWTQFSPVRSLQASAGRPLEITLAPYEALVLEAQSAP